MTIFMALVPLSSFQFFLVLLLFLRNGNYVSRAAPGRASGSASKSDNSSSSQCRLLLLGYYLSKQALFVVLLQQFIIHVRQAAHASPRISGP